MIDSVILEDLDPLRINVEADLTRGDLHRSPQRYPVSSADALSDREFDRVRAGGPVAPAPGHDFSEIGTPPEQARPVGV